MSESLAVRCLRRGKWFMSDGRIIDNFVLSDRRILGGRERIMICRGRGANGRYYGTVQTLELDDGSFSYAFID